jgi:hypothetical protein
MMETWWKSKEAEFAADSLEFFGQPIGAFLLEAF